MDKLLNRIIIACCTIAAAVMLLYVGIISNVPTGPEPQRVEELEVEEQDLIYISTITYSFK